MADFVAVIRRAVGGLTDNSPDMRGKVYDKARGAVRRQLEAMNPRPSRDLILKQYGKLEEAIAEVEAENPSYFGWLNHSVVHVDVAQAVHQEESTPIPPPEQAEGPHFKISGNGRLQIMARTFATERDMVEIGLLREGLADAADDLVERTAGSNAFHHIHQMALRYRAALGTGENDMAIDALCMHGVRLQNSARRIAEQIASNDYPEMSLAIGEALDSLVALHGPTVMSTEAGRSFVRKSQEYSFTPEKIEQYRAASSPLIEHAISSDLFEESDAADLVAMNSDAGSGPVPAQSSALAHVANANFLTLCATLAITSIAGPMIANGIAESQPVISGSAAVTTVIDNVWLFFTDRPDLFLQLAAAAAAAGADLSWLPSFVRWAQNNRLRAIATNAVIKAIDIR